MAAWTKEETLKLIELWSYEDIQAQLEGCKRNQQVYEKIASLMQKEGFTRTYQQCREKIKKLRQQYKKVKDKIRQTGQQGRQHLISKFVYFNALDNILGNRPATEPMVVIDSFSGKSEVDVESNVSESDHEGKEEQEAELWESDMKESEARQSSTTTVVSNEDSGSSKDVIVVKKEDKVNVKPIVSNKKKRKRQLEVMQDTMKGLIKEVVDAQKASDKMYVELEEKRLKMEEAQLERESKMRRDDQEFQMRVLQMITGSYHMSQPSLNMFPSYSGSTPPYSGINQPYSRNSSPYPNTSPGYSGDSQ